MERFYRTIALSGFAWPTGECRRAADLAVSPEILDGWFGVPLEVGHEGEEPFRVAALELPSGRRVQLRWYEHAPEPRGLRLLADASDDPDQACEETLLVLGLVQNDVMAASQR